MFVGYDSFADATTRGQIRNAFEAGTSVVTNWDIMEGVLDYTFIQLGLDATEGGIGKPVVMTEAVANLGYSRKSKFTLPINGYCQQLFSDERTPF